MFDLCQLALFEIEVVNMDALNLNDLTAQLLPAVWAAAAVEMTYFRQGVTVQHKADQSPVTAADREAEALLIAALNTAMPGIPVIAEEQSASGVVTAIGDQFFLVDPLDGTRQFIDGNPEFTINIGLIDCGTPVYGLIFAPALDRFFVTMNGGVAAQTMVDLSKPLQSLSDSNLVPMQTRCRPSGGLVALTSRSHHGSAATAYLDTLNLGATRQTGSSLKFALIAAGEADVYPRFGPTSEWDTAAGQALLQAAGGSVELVSGGPLTYGHADRNFVNPNFVAWGQRLD